MPITRSFSNKKEYINQIHELIALNEQLMKENQFLQRKLGDANRKADQDEDKIIALSMENSILDAKCKAAACISDQRNNSEK